MPEDISREDLETIANNQVVIDKEIKGQKETLTKLEKALTDALTPKEKKEIEAKNRTATVSDIEEALKNQKIEEKKERDLNERIHQLQTLAEEKLDVAESVVEKLFEKAELEYDEDAKEDFDDWSDKFIKKGLEEQKENGARKFDWEKFNDRMKTKFQKSYRIKLEEGEEEEEEEKPKAKSKSPKSLTGLNDEVSPDLKPGNKFDKMIAQLEGHRRVKQGTPKAGDRKLSEIELIEYHRIINREKNKQTRMAMAD